MYLLVLALVLTLLKFLNVGPVGAWSWWWILLPYVLTALWWVFADSIGYSKRKAAQKMEQRQQERLEKQRKELGMPPRRH